MTIKASTPAAVGSGVAVAQKPALPRITVPSQLSILLACRLRHGFCEDRPLEGRAATFDMRIWHAQRVVVVLPPAIGDVMMTIPLLAALHDGGWRVHTVLDEGLAGLRRAYEPYADYEYLVPAKRWRATSVLRDLPGRLALAARIRAARYDALIHVGSGSLGAWLTAAARIPVSIARDTHHKVALKRWASRVIYRYRVTVPDVHGVLVGLALAGPLGVPPAPPQFARLDPGRNRRNKALATTVVVAPDASEPGRALPLGEARALVARLRVVRPAVRIIVIGVGGGIAERLATSRDITAAHIGDSLDTIVSVIATAGCLIAADSGPGHIAAACGTPVVSIFGPGDPRTARPWLARDKLVVVRNERRCQPCRANGCQGSGVAECLEHLPVAAIVAQAYRLADAHAGPD